jgi:hypothetical protein
MSIMKRNISFGLGLILLICAPAVRASTSSKKPVAGEDKIVIENGLVRVAFSRTDGAIVGLTDQARGVVYIDGDPDVPFRLDDGSDLKTRFESFAWTRDESFKAGTACDLRWTIGDGLTLKARIELLKGADEVSFTSRLENRGSRTVMAVEYPILGGLKSIAPNDILVHSYATGFLARNPFESFGREGGGLRFMPYPESFSGASMQFGAYYAPGKGGIYFAAYDGSYGQKWLNFFRTNGRLEASLMYGYEDIGPGKGIEAPFRYVLKTFAGDNWYQAADIYKAWAVHQDWCRQGTLAGRAPSDRAQWLLEKAGLSTFGIDASRDLTPWIRRYHEDVGSPIFHVLGVDWPKIGPNYADILPGGMPDWFPTRFSKENLALIKEQGDYFAPFEFDFLVDPKRSDSALLKANLEIFPAKPRSRDDYAFAMLCPTTEFTRTFHRDRDVRVFEESGCDGMYYDISANNLIKTDLSPSHGHRVGGGKEITLAYKRIYSETKKAMAAKAGKFMPLGTEMMCEVFLPELDYYQARAGAQPSSAFEMGGLAFRDLLEAGRVEVIPLFTYVYHEYGAVRLDGWGKLVAEAGELFFNIAAKVYLWGGLYELNSEYSPLEALDGRENDPLEHYFKFEPMGFAYNPDMAHYLEQFAFLRTGPGNKYLAYGTMLKPPDIGPTDTPMSWFHYNIDRQAASYKDRGTIVVPGVIHTAWKAGGDSNATYGFIFANTTAREVTIKARIDKTFYGLAGTGWKARLCSKFGRTGYTSLEQGPVGPDKIIPLALTIAPRKVVLVEFYKSPSKAR